MKIFPLFKSGTIVPLRVLSVLAILIIYTVSVQIAPAQLFHGVAVFKDILNGTPPKPGELVTARISVLNLDDFQDTQTILSVIDVVHHASGDVTNNLLITPVTIESYLVSTNNDELSVITTYPVLPEDKDLPFALLLDDCYIDGTDNHDGLGASFLPQSFHEQFPNQVVIDPPPVGKNLSLSENCLSADWAPMSPGLWKLQVTRDAGMTWEPVLHTNWTTTDVRAVWHTKTLPDPPLPAEVPAYGVLMRITKE